MAKRKSREGREQGFMARRAGPSARGGALEAHLPKVELYRPIFQR